MKTIDEYLNQNPVLQKAVVAFAIKGDEVLLGCRTKVTDGLGQDLYAGLGGKVGDKPEIADETSEEALKRELSEEVKIEVLEYHKAGRVRFLWTSKPKWNMDVDIFIITKWAKAPKKTDVIEPVWVKINDLPTSKMWEDNRYWVPKVLAGETINAIFLYGDNQTIIEHRFE